MKNMISEDCKQSSQKFWLQETWIVSYSVFWNLLEQRMLPYSKREGLKYIMQEQPKPVIKIMSNLVLSWFLPEVLRSTGNQVPNVL